MKINKDYLLSRLTELLSIPSPSGYTDEVVRYTCEQLDELGIPYELTRRGAIRAMLCSKYDGGGRAIVSHLDTLGAMIKGLKDNGRLQIVPIGFWSSRFAESCRVTVFTNSGPKRGTILPLKASGHTFNEEIDQQPVNWENVELRVDEDCYTKKDLEDHGFQIGDFISIDPCYEYTKSGYLVSRHLDNKAGVASVLAAAEALTRQNCKLPENCYLLFTISEEVGSGASAILHGDIAEMVSVDNSTVAPGQNSIEKGVTVAMKDSSGPFDYHLTQKILNICHEHKIFHSRDVFRYYRCDAASAIEAGNDIRTALVCFGCDASHGYERTHEDSLMEMAKLLALYAKSDRSFPRDRENLSGLDGLPKQPTPPPTDPSATDTIHPDEYKDD